MGSGKTVFSIIILAVVVFVSVAVLAPRRAMACVPCSSSCLPGHVQNTINEIMNQHNITRQFISDEFRNHHNWLFGANGYGIGNSFFHDHVLPALMMMTEQLTVNGMMQMMAIGSFFDAKIQLETQRLYQVKTAEAHKDYQSSFDMCVIGTNTRSLAAARRLSDVNKYVLGERALARDLGMHAQASAETATEDRESRLNVFIARHCSPRDNNNVTTLLCPVATPLAGLNKDIDYGRVVDHEKTIDVDFTRGMQTLPLPGGGGGTYQTPHDYGEIDIIALANNLYNSDVFTRHADEEKLFSGEESLFLDTRNIVAKRNVIQNSFNAIVGLKSMGSTNSTLATNRFMTRVLEQLGVANAQDRNYMLSGYEDGMTGITGGTFFRPGERPSYYAQMEILSQKIYQNPEFFINLYDKPANVARKDVAMQAIGLMLNRDTFESELRTEMTMAVMVEIELMKYQRDIQNRINGLKDE